MVSLLKESKMTLEWTVISLDIISLLGQSGLTCAQVAQAAMATSL